MIHIIEIQETLTKLVAIEADTIHDAREIAENAYDGDIITIESGENYVNHDCTFEGVDSFEELPEYWNELQVIRLVNDDN